MKRDDVKIRRSIRKFIEKNPDANTRLITEVFGEKYEVPKQNIACNIRWLHARNKKTTKRDIDIITIVPGKKSISRIATSEKIYKIDSVSDDFSDYDFWGATNDEELDQIIEDSFVD
jgi:hypothetical protein